MASFKKSVSNHFFRRQPGLVLAFISSCGCFCGFITADIAGSILSVMVCTASTGSVSTVGLVFGAVLPFLFAAVAVQFLNPWCLLPVCFLKCFTYCFLLHGTFLAFPSAGWLAAFFLQFTDHISLMLFHCLCFRCLSARFKQGSGEITVYVVLLLIAAAFDCLYIAPFYASAF